jgi:hypothetical protein
MIAGYSKPPGFTTLPPFAQASGEMYSFFNVCEFEEALREPSVAPFGSIRNIEYLEKP